MPAWQDYILGSLLNVTAQITEYIPLLVLFHTHIDQTTAKQHLPDWKLKGANKHMLRIHPTKFEATQIGVNKTAQAEFWYFCPFPRNIYEIFILYWLLNTVSIIHYLQFIINYFFKDPLQSISKYTTYKDSYHGRSINMQTAFSEIIGPRLKI
jgi:hypothetical protein